MSTGLPVLSGFSITVCFAFKRVLWGILHDAHFTTSQNALKVYFSRNSYFDTHGSLNWSGDSLHPWWPCSHWYRRLEMIVAGGRESVDFVEVVGFVNTDSASSSMVDLPSPSSNGPSTYCTFRLFEGPYCETESRYRHSWNIHRKDSSYAPTVFRTQALRSSSIKN